jgi:hypothetical protein
VSIEGSTEPLETRARRSISPAHGRQALGEPFAHPRPLAGRRCSASIANEKPVAMLRSNAS